MIDPTALITAAQIARTREAKNAQRFYYLNLTPEGVLVEGCDRSSLGFGGPIYARGLVYYEDIEIAGNQHLIAALDRIDHQFGVKLAEAAR